MNAHDLQIEFDRTDKRGRMIVSVRQGQKTLAVETVNLLSSDKRMKFVESIRAANPGMPDDVIEDLRVELLRVAGINFFRLAFGFWIGAIPLDATPQEVKNEALAMLRNPRLIQIVTEDIAQMGIAGERILGMTIYLVGTSRLLQRPLALIILGLSSSGKSYLISQVSSLHPQEAVIRAHKMTQEALIHLPKGALVHRFVVAGERRRKQDDDGAEATRSLREMLSDGKLTKLMPTKQGGKIVTVKIEQPGPIAFVESTTVQRIFDEDRNRCLVLATDETETQTARILDSLAADKATTTDRSAREQIVAKHHAAQRMLQPCRVVVPFAPRLARLFPRKRTDARRAFGHLLSLIEAVALLHQYQRVDNPGPGVEIVATRFDYEVARKLVGGMFTEKVDGGYTPGVRRFGDRVRKCFEGTVGDFDARDVAKHESLISDLQTIREYLRILHDVGELEQTQPHRGQQPARYMLVVPAPHREAATGLPSSDDVFGCASAEPDRDSATNDNPLPENELRCGTHNSATNGDTATNQVDEETRIDAETVIPRRK